MTAEELSKTYPPLSQIRILLRLVEISDEKKAFDLTDPSSPQCTGFEVHGIRNAEEFLLELASAGIIDFEVIGEDGYEPARFGNLKTDTFDYLRRLVSMVDGQVKSLDSRVEALLAFRPAEILEEITGTESSLNKMIALSAANPDLQPLIRHLKVFATHLHSIKTIASHYDDVYKIIIRPIQEEGRAGVKATTYSAIISIIISAILSLLITTWLSSKQKKLTDNTHIDALTSEATAEQNGKQWEAVAIIHDRSASIRDGCASTMALVNRILNSPRQENRTLQLLVLGTGDSSSNNEPILANNNGFYSVPRDILD